MKKVSFTESQIRILKEVCEYAIDQLISSSYEVEVLNSITGEQQEKEIDAIIAKFK